MPSAPHRACFDWPAEPRCGAALSTGVYSCSWFSFGFYDTLNYRGLQSVKGYVFPQDMRLRLTSGREIKQEVFMKVPLAQVHWGRVLLASILVVILTIILNYVVLLFVLRIWGQMKQAIPAFFLDGICSSSLLILLLTLVFATRVARNVEREPQLHGFLVGLIAALLLFFISSGFQGQFALVTTVTTILVVVAGWLGGILGSRGR
jgi:hypothetical protein